jgi:pyruvate formate lyase activating enzyme
MLISGVQKFTMLDYPDKIAAIVFTPGCNMRCGFCHNKEFVLPEEIKELQPSFIPQQAILNFLKNRKGKLDGLVISGGEPTVQPDLKDFIKEVRKMGFLVKLDTNGNLSDILKDLVNEKLVDYVAMDVKTTLENYTDLVGDMANPDEMSKSINFLKQGSVSYEFRTTIIDGIHPIDIIKKMAKLLEGSDKLYLQKFRPETTLDPKFQTKKPVSDKQIKEFIKIFEKKNIKEVDIRQ